MPERRPRLNVGAKHAFLYEYYEQCKNEDDEFFQSICRILIVNRGFLGTFFNRQSQKRTNEDEGRFLGLGFGRGHSCKKQNGIKI